MRGNKKLTKLTTKGGAELINPLYVHRAIKKLYDFEFLEKTPHQIADMEATIVNLQNRIKELEDW